MCGIAGFLSLDGSLHEPSRALLSSMILAMQHRGPDGQEVFLNGPVGLAHARLSIIDLAGGTQPMAYPEAGLTVTFNGEIFNYIELKEELVAKGHVFRTRSDTEVLLHLYQEYGEEFVHKLNGQWAFAIWNERERTLFLSRDRMGVRPLFYTVQGGVFAFASEIKSIFQLAWVRREIDPLALDDVFTFWHPLPPRSIFKDILQIPPGHSLKIKTSDTVPQVTRYWRPNFQPDFSLHNEDDVIEELRSLLSDATRLRLRSDVPVGAYVSGGLDSSVTAGLVREHAKRGLHTFSVAFEDQDYDESTFQKEVADLLGTSHNSVNCAYHHIHEAFPEVIWHTEQPLVRTAPAPLFRLSRLVRNSGFKVVLTGEGADEVLGGYDIFKEAKIRRFWATSPDSKLRPLLLKRLYPYMSHVHNQPLAYLKAFFRASTEDLHDPLFSHLPRWELGAKNRLFFSRELQAQLRERNPLDDVRALLPSEFQEWDYFSRAQYLELTLLLPGYILCAQGDRMAMAHSIEGRFPFLDYRVVEFGCRIPARLKMKGLNEKFILKQAARDIVPPNVLARPKQPYRAPDARSFSKTEGRSTHNYVDDFLSPSKISDTALFHPGAVTKLVEKLRNDQLSGVKDNMAFVGILSTQLLAHQFIENMGRYSHGS